MSSLRSCGSSAPGSATAAAAPPSSGSTTSRRTPPSRSPSNPANDYMPVWIGDTVYFVSDRDKVGSTTVNNLFAYDTKTRAVRRVTNHDTFDVYWPSSADRRRIVYEDGGSIYLFDPASGKSEPDPHPGRGRPAADPPLLQERHRGHRRDDPLPTGKRALLRPPVATSSRCRPRRGRSATSPSRRACGRWPPPGRPTAAGSPTSPTAPASTRSGVRPADGSGEERRVTTDGDTWRFPLAWSPDSQEARLRRQERAGCAGSTSPPAR